MKGYRPGFLLFPLTDGVAVLATAMAVAAGSIPYGGLLFLLLPPALFLPIVRGFGTAEERAVFVGPGARQFLIDWGRTLVVTAVVLFPVPLLFVMRALADDVPGLDGVANVVLQLSVFVFPILAAFYPAHLAALAIKNDVLWALLPGPVAEVRKKKMDSDASVALVVVVVIGGFLTVVFAGLAQSLLPEAGGPIARALWIWLADQIAILVGLSLQGRVSKRILLGLPPLPSNESAAPDAPQP